MEIKIPEAFAAILQGNTGLQGGLMLSFAEFEPWLRLSGTPFFPEYTDHGLAHINDVMTTSSAIVRDTAWEVITPADVAALALAILLHDSAMHIAEDGFITLVNPNSNRPLITGTLDKPWPGLWTEFLGEASRFDARQLNSLFGDTEPAHVPGPDIKNWSSRDKLLIGEFLRRHHSRLAHEIALWGVPGVGGNTISLRGIATDVADIAGLIGRSHGQSIRSAFPYLQKYDIREYKGIHAVFLMTVVRIADYLQVQSDRAPQQILRLRGLKSPISQGEWQAHEAVRDLRNTHEDPEAVFVDAAPKDVRTYLKLKRLLAGIQDELDASWAALGEVYGRYPGLDNLGLALRRVRSNLDDELTFAASVPYVPCRAAFEAADADLLKLLIGPLYGEEPEIGIRELIQNAVDACRELSDHLLQRPDLSDPDLPKLPGDVVVILEKGSEKNTGWIEVADRGIGMTVEVVTNYFLKAGASFRHSDAWRRSHEEQPGKSRVLRSGRFGIGALASFLLGNEIEVSTRHVSAPSTEGVAFKATIESSEIELVRTTRPVGTTVRIKITDPKVWESLSVFNYSWEDDYKAQGESWDWHCLSEPNVVRIVRTRKGNELLKQEFSLPVAGPPPPEFWYEITHPDYLAVHWTYQRVPVLTCNGMKVIDADRSWYSDSTDHVNDLWERGGLGLRCPNISVFDPDGHLPLLLQRTGLATPRYPFHEDLLQDVVKDLLAFILVNAPSAPVLDASTGEAYHRWYGGFRIGGVKWLMHFCLPGGTALTDLSHLQRSASKRILLLPSAREFPNVLREMSLPDTILPFAGLDGPQARNAWFRCNLGGHSDSSFGPATDLDRSGCRMLIRERTLRELRQPGVIAKFYWPSIKEEFSTNGWVLLYSGECPTPGVDFRKIAEIGDGTCEGIAEWYLPTDQPAVPQTARSPIAIAWDQIIQAPLIPYDINERRQALAGAFSTLKTYVATQERLRELKMKAGKPESVTATTQ
jgi:molecular chaperone HtpG